MCHLDELRFGFPTARQISECSLAAPMHLQMLGRARPCHDATADKDRIVDLLKAPLNVLSMLMSM